MYFAINSWPDDLPEKLLDRLNSQHPPNCDSNTYALVDMSFAPDLVQQLPKLRLKAHSLYTDTRLAGLLDVSPHLVPLAKRNEQQLRGLNTLAHACRSKPMLSLLVSPLNASDLCRHFTPWLLAKTDDGSEWPTRWADTRVLPNLLDCLSDNERTELLAPLQAWLVVDRSAQIHLWPGQGRTTPSGHEGPWQLDDTRYARLLDAGEADAVISQIDDRQHALLEGRLPAEVHREVSRLLGIASTAGIHAAGERQHFASLGLMLKPEFTEHPALQSLLHQTRQGADYLPAIAQLPEAFWQANSRST